MAEQSPNSSTPSGTDPLPGTDSVDAPGTATGGDNPHGELPGTETFRPGTMPAGAGGDLNPTLAGGPEPSGGPVPATIGRYRVIRELGHGGFGTVYLGHDEPMDRAVAIKVPRADRLQGEAALSAFLSEARHVSRLKHPGIVTVHDFAQADGQCYLVYEFIEGMSLAARMQQGPVPAREAAALVAQVADALHYAHRENVFHRDIKPSNILLDTHGQPHVTDFGIAVREDELAGETGRRSGTCPYQSPEQVRGEGHRIDGRTDIYSLGVVLYELLCGRPPFDRRNEDVLTQIATATRGRHDKSATRYRPNWNASASRRCPSKSAAAT